MIEFLLGWRIAAAADDTALPAPPAADPMSAMLASMGIGKQAQAQTVMDYDRQQLGKVGARHSLVCPPTGGYKGQGVARLHACTTLPRRRAGGAERPPDPSRSLQIPPDPLLFG